VKSKPKDGTTRFIRFASVGVQKDGCRFQLKVLPVMPGTPKEEIVKRLLDAAHQQVSISTVLLDREFYVEDVIELLMPRWRFLMPAKQYPKVKVHMQKCIDEGLTSIEYEMTGGTTYTLFPHYDERKKRHVAFATNMDVGECGASSLANLYRKRFGIDTQYRIKNNFKLKTCSKVYSVRYTAFMISIVLYNLWVWINIISSLVERMAPGKPTIPVDDLVFAYTCAVHRAK
jgi:IS4 transposase